jgi:hypothetical protein
MPTKARCAIESYHITYMHPPVVAEARCVTQPGMSSGSVAGPERCMLVASSAARFFTCRSRALERSRRCSVASSLGKHYGLNSCSPYSVKLNMGLNADDFSRPKMSKTSVAERLLVTSA